MTTVAEMLKRLSMARDKSHFNMIWGGMASRYKNNTEAMRSLTEFRMLVELGRRTHGTSRKAINRRF